MCQSPSATAEARTASRSTAALALAASASTAALSEFARASVSEIHRWAAASKPGSPWPREKRRAESSENLAVSVVAWGFFFVLKKAKRFNQSKLYLFFFLSLSCIPSLLLRFKLTSEIVATASLRASASCGVPRSLSAAKARREARAAPGAKQAARACDCFVVVDFDFLNEVG